MDTDIDVKADENGQLPLPFLNAVAKRAARAAAAEKLALTAEVKEVVADLANLPRPTKGLPPRPIVGKASPKASQLRADARNKA